MIVLKYNSCNSEKEKAYKVLEGVLYIDNEPVEIDETLDFASLDVSESEDFESITKEGDVVTMKVNFFCSQETKMDFFSIVKKGSLIEDAKFPYQVLEDKTILWENDIKALEGMEW